MDYYLKRGKCYQRTIKQLGYPTRATLRKWIEEMAPNERKIHQNKVEYTQDQKIEAVAAYFGRIRTLIPETSGQRFGIIRTS